MESRDSEVEYSAAKVDGGVESKEPSKASEQRGVSFSNAISSCGCKEWIKDEGYGNNGSSV